MKKVVRVSGKIERLRGSLATIR